MMTDENFRKCVFDFAFFAKNYLQVRHPIKGSVLCEIHPYHERLFEAYGKHNHNIVKKFRQGGFTTMTLLWLMWKCMFQCDQRALYLVKSDREAIGAGEIVNHALRNLPEWLAPVIGRDNAHSKQFLDTGSTMDFLPFQACRGRSANWILIDEPAFVPNMDIWWKSIEPMAYGSKVFVLSTPNGRGNWFEKTYTEALEDKNCFNVIPVSYLENPMYQDSEFCDKLQENLGTIGWSQEIMASFD